MPAPDGQIVYGNEWIDYDKSYLRIPIAEDGMYILTYEDLLQAGWNSDSWRGQDLVLFHHGKQIPIRVSTEGVFSEEDHLIFYGEKNRTTLERFIFHQPDRQMLNPEYSLFTDTSVYFLTLDQEIAKTRFQQAQIQSTSDPRNWVWTSITTVYTGQFYTQAPQGLIDPDFNDLEGFATGFARTVKREIILSDLNVTGDSLYLSVGVGCDLNTRAFNLSVNGNQIEKFTNDQDQSARIVQLSLPVGSLGNTLEIEVEGVESNNRVALSFVTLRFETPTTTLDSSREFFLSDSQISQTFGLSVPGDIHPGPIYNIRQGRYYLPDEQGNNYVYHLEAMPGDRFVPGPNPIRPTGLRKVHFTNFLDQDMDYLIITSEFFIGKDGEQDQIEAYAGYRRSTEGGAYKVVVATVEELRDQFIFGVEGHPYAIRNFVGLLIQEQKGVRYINIIGKGMGYGFIRSASDYQNYHGKSHFVPTFGHYGSDNLLVAEKGQAVPRIPVGRIPVTKSEEIGYYLEKVRTYENVLRHPEQVEDRTWMKRVMHFNGGDRNIYSTISNFMDNLGREMQKDTFSAQLISYYKSSFGGTEIPERDEIFEYINEGAALISFFGHSASSSLDFNIDIIEEYGNTGRLPVFLALGCSSGNIFLPGKNLAEKFILTPDIGSILFLSTATSQYLSNLQSLARQFYDELGSKQYGGTLGNIVQQSLARMGRFQKHMQSVFVFTGDPALSSYHFDGPDFTFNPSSTTVTPTRPSLIDESFTLDLEIQNLGRLNRDTFAVLVRHQLPGGETRTLDTIWQQVNGFSTTLQIEIPITDQMEGRNTFFLTLDPDNQIKEYPEMLGETNNAWVLDGKTGFDVFIQNTTLQLIYPYDHAIIPVEKPTLEIFNGNVDHKIWEYVIELDTTPHFNSTIKKLQTTSSRVSRIQVPVESALTAGQVYYWRARWAQDSVFTAYQSFIPIPDRSGWNQSHFGQFQRDSLVDVSLGDHSLDFAELQNVYKLDHGHKKADNLFNEIHRPRFFRTDHPALNVSIFKPRANSWVRNPKPGLYNSIWPVAGDEFLFTFVFRPQNKLHRQSIVELIEKEAEEGDYILFWNTTNGNNSPNGASWALDSIDNQGVNLFNFFEARGATQIRALEEIDRRAYSLIYQVGGEVVTEILGDSAGINVEYVNLPSYTDRGQIWTDPVTFLQTLESWEAGMVGFGRDSMELTLYTGELQEKLSIHAGTSSVQNGDLGQGRAHEFYWSADIFDMEKRTFPQFYWRIFGEFKSDLRVSNLPDVALVDTADIEKNILTVHFSVGQEGEITADSIQVSIELFNANRTLDWSVSLGRDQLGQPVSFTWPVSQDYRGSSTLKITVDPDNQITEAREDNNSIFWNFDIVGDRIAPTLSVLFDQQTILNGDIVAPNSLITVDISDFPNQNLSSSDPQYTFEITKPSGTVLKIDATNPSLTMEPKEGGMELRYQSDFDENGLYEMRVNVRDNAGNTPKSDLVLNFEVILENSISEILPYPNPFVNAVRFAYTLTGTEEPDIFRIRIYTVSGRLVKEITKEEFGPMRIGRHLSEYVWDGRDNWNQDLAPGVYLYQVISRDREGSEYEKYQINEIDRGGYIKNGFGKMVKLR